MTASDFVTSVKVMVAQLPAARVYGFGVAEGGVMVGGYTQGGTLRKTVAMADGNLAPANDVECALLPEEQFLEFVEGAGAEALEGVAEQFAQEIVEGDPGSADDQIPPGILNTDLGDEPIPAGVEDIFAGQFDSDVDEEDHNVPDAEDEDA